MIYNVFEIELLNVQMNVSNDETYGINSELFKSFLCENYGWRKFRIKPWQSNDLTEFIQKKFNLWYSHQRQNIDRIIEALKSEYNPIENYDRTEETTRKNTGTQTDRKTGQDTTEYIGGESQSVKGSNTDTQSGSRVTQYGSRDSKSVAAFNSSSPTPQEVNEKSGSDTDTYNNIKNVNSSETTTTNSFNGRSDVVEYGTEQKRTDDLSETITSRIHGNIGVTTSAQMIAGEMEIRKFNLLRYCAESFLNTFTFL